MNKHLYRKLLQRGALGTIKEIERRERITERGDVIYSTKEAELATRNVDKNRGCAPASDQIRSKNSFDTTRYRSGREHAIQREGKIFWTQPFSMRMMRSR